MVMFGLVRASRVKISSGLRPSGSDYFFEGADIDWIPPPIRRTTTVQKTCVVVLFSLVVVVGEKICVTTTSK
jgi:hypothetical protein